MKRCPACVVFALLALLHLAAAGLSQAADSSPVRLYELTCEHLRNPLGIGAASPRLSWKLRSDRIGEVQTAYQVRAATSPSGLEAGQPDLWDSGRIASDQSVLVPWAGKPLGSRSEVFWQVRVWDKNNQSTRWSETASFELGLLDAGADWKGQWITADLPRFVAASPSLAGADWITAAGTNQTVALRRNVEIPPNARVRSAVAEISAEGGFTFYVNGRQARRANNRPDGWKKPTRADFGTLLVPGTNVLAIAAPSSHQGGVIGHFLIELESGCRIELKTDGSWKAAPTPGSDWQTAGSNDGFWPGASVLGEYGAAPWGDFLTDNATGPGRYVRKTFVAKDHIIKARLYATALGVYEASINGQAVTDTLLNPGWTDYTRRVMVQTFDVTRLLSKGQNTLGAVLGDGWYAGRLGWMGLAQYGTRPSFNAQLEITYADGTQETVASDGSWKAGFGEIVGSDPQWGEFIDARKAMPDWDRTAFDDSAWTNATIEQSSVALVPQLGPPVRKLLELAPRSITRLGDGWIVDLGQNMVGHVRLSAHGPSGTAITVRHGEALNSDGSLYTANLRPARATDTFVLKGLPGRETFEPHFTFHGFRYVEISGYPGTPTTNDLRGIVAGSDVPATGSFECSNAEVNRLYQNILWGQRGNFLSVPTDCPQRDERMGWMGDAQVFAPTAVRNADVAAFFAKWLVDVDDGQSQNGDYSDVSPRVARPQPAMPAWGDAGVICPWILYTAYGDKKFLADNYPSMVRWVEYCRRGARAFLRPGQGVGDHLNPGVVTPLEVVATAYFANSAHIVARSAALLDKPGDAAVFDKLFHNVAGAFTKAYVASDGTIKGNTQTAYLLALQFDLVPAEIRPALARRLTEDIEKRGHLSTGFLGVGLICPGLTQLNRSDLAWQLVLNDAYPSWLFPVKNGATTIWERWDGWTPEHGFQDPAMNSFNHYSLGSVGEWLYSGAAGIELDETHPGYKQFSLAPQFTPRLSGLKASVDSPYGVISSAWHTDRDQILYDATIPPNSSAMLMLPFSPDNVRQSGTPVSNAGAAATRLPLAAGTYHFSFPRQLIK
jgi:alpha-L-rhamnosidase